MGSGEEGEGGFFSSCSSCLGCNACNENQSDQPTSEESVAQDTGYTYRETNPAYQPEVIPPSEENPEEPEESSEETE